MYFLTDITQLFSELQFYLGMNIFNTILYFKITGLNPFVNTFQFSQQRLQFFFFQQTD